MSNHHQEPSTEDIRRSRHAVPDADDDPSVEITPRLIVTEREGGPYDTASFVAGMQAARADRQLWMAEHCGAQKVTVAVWANVVPMVDLYAAAHGFPFVTVETSEKRPEWAWVTAFRAPTLAETPPE